MHRLALIGGLVAFLLSACGDDGEDAGEGAADAAPGGPEVDAGPSPAEPDAGTTVIEDPCEGQTPVCPAASGLTEGAGLAPIDRCAFPMEDRDTWSDSGALVDGLAAALDPVSLTDVLGDLNRTAAPIAAGDLPGDVPGVESAFGWQSGDESVGYWIPQGITGSGDGVAGGRVDGRRVLLVSWYYDREQDPGSTADKGVRLAVVDATDPASIHYRFVLLVEPVAGEGGPSFGPIRVHAGGLAWVGDYLYVVDTSHGFRVFDMTRILRVQTGVDSIGLDPASGDYYAHNYAYVVPQVGTYAQTSSCDPRFSFVSVDRTSDPPSLVTGEYDADTIYGRLYRWPLDANGRLRRVGDAGRVVPDGAWFSSHTHVQGGLAEDGTFWLSSSKPAGARGILYRTGEGRASADLGWSDTPEDLSFDPSDGLLWSLSEGLGARYVFSLPLAAVE
ncbi:MAG TPA: hypothetical protein VK698_35420 [Kofleriaceae bacterium]|nr:hypothetical protein [Kofleriaceae bacterium]